MTIAEKIHEISMKIAKSCERSSRNAKAVSLMLVTKTVPVDRILLAVQCGHKLFGENKIQEVQQKWSEPELHILKPDFIGHLQTNKVKSCIDLCGRIE